MIDGIVTQDLIDVDEIMPYAPYPVYPSGLNDEDKSHIRYGHPANQNPTLTIIDTVYDIEYNPVIVPGHYELAISDDRAFLLLIQSRRLVAKIPVFKLEEDKTEAQKVYDKKEMKKQKKEKKKLAKKAEKLAKRGLKPEQPFVYSNAEIEYVKKGGYYLIKYERGSIRAWGAIKE